MKETPKTKIRSIVTTFGMKSSVVAKAMNVTTNTVFKKNNDKELRHCFNEKNYLDLVEYVNLNANKLPQSEVIS